MHGMERLFRLGNLDCRSAQYLSRDPVAQGEMRAEYPPDFSVEPEKK